MSTLAFYAQFTKSLVGVNSLSVTWDIEQITRADGTRSALVTGGATSITIGRRGLYGYLLASADTKLYDYVATAITAGDVDQKEIAALWTMYEADALKIAATATAVPGAQGGLPVLDANLATSANVTTLKGQSEPVDNLVLALGHTDGILSHPQGVRDALKLAPTAGTPADGSVDDHLDDLATALATANVTVVSAVDGGEINIYQAVTLAATISGLAIPAGWTKVYWTVKRATSEVDTDAILQMVETNPSAGTDGLLRVNGAAGTAGNGSLTVDQAAGTVVIDLVMTVCDDLALATGLVWSLKALHPTSAATLLATGTVNVLGQATMAVA